MTIMKISASIDNAVKLEVTNVSIKYYRFEHNIAYNLFKKFKELKPTKVVFEGRHDSFEYFIEFLETYGARIDSNGKVDYINKLGNVNIDFNNINHSIQEESNRYTITVNGGHDQYKIYEILLNNDYIISSKVEKDKVHISIHGKN